MRFGTAMCGVPGHGSSRTSRTTYLIPAAAFDALAKREELPVAVPVVQRVHDSRRYNSTLYVEVLPTVGSPHENRSWLEKGGVAVQSTALLGNKQLPRLKNVAIVEFFDAHWFPLEGNRDVICDFPRGNRKS
jgi:hypothetical protein